VSRSGLDDGGDGMITLGIGIVLVLVALASLGSGGLGGISRVLGFLGGAGAIAVAVIDGSDISNRIASISSSYVTASIGMGLYVVGIGGALALLASLFGARAKPPAPTATPVA
jgi:hypothetical protein